MGGIFCILQLHVNLKIHLVFFNHHNYKSHKPKRYYLFVIAIPYGSFLNIMTRFNAMWRGAVLYSCPCP